ncbi:replication-relaxation family protein [candidate division KSB1 bacterium]|nr:replication-relaxation family protein [candidate division KSB1 bacterium]
MSSSTTTKWTSRYKRAELDEPLKLRKVDEQILEWFLPGKFKYLTPRMLAVLLDYKIDSVQKRLRVLFDAHYLKRIYRPQGPTGSTEVVYTLDKVGAKHLTQLTGQKVKVYDTKGPNEYRLMLDHALAINTFLVCVIAACEVTENVSLSFFYPDHEFSWRVDMGEKKFESLVPDAVVGIIKDGVQRNFFVEVQRSTGKTKQGIKSKDERYTVRRKLQRYHTLKKSPYNYLDQFPNENYPELENPKNMRVLYISEVGGQEYENALEIGKKASGNTQGSALIWFTQLENIDIERPESVFGEIWDVPHDVLFEHKKTIIE